jgi:CRP-like cAMP-binding protein
MALAHADAVQVAMTSPLFAGLDESKVRTIVAAAKRRRYTARQIVLQSSEAASHLFLLISGHARDYFLTDKGQRLLVRWLGVGAVFGLQSLGHGSRKYDINTEMVRPGEILVWQRDTIQQLAIKNPAVFANALTLAMDYLVHYHSIHMGLASHTAEQRLAQALLGLTESLGQELSRGVQIDVKNKHLADMANVTFFTASRILSSWHRNGLIVKSRGKIVLRSRERLSALFA